MIIKTMGGNGSSLSESEEPGTLASKSTEIALVLRPATDKGTGAMVYILLGLYECSDDSGLGGIKYLSRSIIPYHHLNSIVLNSIYTK